MNLDGIKKDFKDVKESFNSMLDIVEMLISTLDEEIIRLNIIIDACANISSKEVAFDE